MSWSIDLYVSGPSSLSALAGEVQRLTGIHLQHFVENGEERFESQEPEHLVMVSKHDLVNDGDRKFELYPYEVAVWPVGSKEKNREVSTAFATRLYEQLEKLPRYRVMLVRDLMDKLRES